MSNIDAQDLNVVLNYLLGTEGPIGRPRPDDALNAARRLAGQAHRTLLAGLRPDQVADAWPMPRRIKKGAAK
jgi:hypothetical protein